MASDKSERLLNLLIMLLVQRHYVSKDRIRSILYPDAGDDAFEKMFERDKEDLRSIGVPIEVGSIDPFFEDEPGYRIRPDEFQLPEISLTGDEAAVVALATKVWEHARLAEATTEAVRKLTAFGLPVDLSALDVVEPRLTADEPSFDVFWEATQDRTPVEFDYQPVRPGRGHAPVTSSRGASSATPAAGTPSASTPTAARSGSSGSPASRAKARRSGRPGSYDIPAGVDIREMARRLAPRLAARAGHRAGPTRRRRRAAPCGRDRRDRRTRPRRRVRLGPAGPASAAAWRSPTSCWPTAPTCTSSPRPRCASASSQRLSAVVGGAAA